MKCIVCGFNDDNACPGDGAWTSVNPDICSACAEDLTLPRDYEEFAGELEDAGVGDLDLLIDDDEGAGDQTVRINL